MDAIALLSQGPCFGFSCISGSKIIKKIHTLRTSSALFLATMLVSGSAQAGEWYDGGSDGMIKKAFFWMLDSVGQIDDIILKVLY